jgi:hypothetical protein
MTTYSSYIERIKVKQEENYADICESVYVVLVRTDEDANFSVGKDIELLSPDYDNFIPFNELTQAQVIEWVENTQEYINMKNIVDNAYASYFEEKNSIKVLVE